VATIYLSLLGAVGYAALNLGVASQVAGGTSRAPVASVVGSGAFIWMAMFQIALVALFSPGLAAGAISGERERQTLDVLLVSRVSAFGIVWGKLVASLAYMLLLILTAFPLFAAVFLFGGIDAGQFALSQLLTITTAICIGSMSLFFSSLFQRSLAATVVSYGSAFVLMVGTAIAGVIASLSQSLPTVTTQQPLAAPWYFNPFSALFIVMSPSPQTHAHLRGFLQLLIGGPAPGQALSADGPMIEPWMVTTAMELAISIACIAGAVAVLRGRRVRRAPSPLTGRAEGAATAE
jgi:ABC-type transport system involved in multi-copper enzyme maturation permease subunit